MILCFQLALLLERSIEPVQALLERESIGAQHLFTFDNLLGQMSGPSSRCPCSSTFFLDLVETLLTFTLCSGRKCQRNMIPKVVQCHLFPFGRFGNAKNLEKFNAIGLIKWQPHIPLMRIAYRCTHIRFTAACFPCVGSLVHPCKLIDALAVVRQSCREDAVCRAEGFGR